MTALRALRDVDLRLFVAAGLVRGAVWDRLHGFPIPTPVADVDAIYFDPGRSHPRLDDDLERQLAARCPGLRWQVRNQARMHLRAGRATPYRDLSHAMAHWPETCTAVAARLDARDRIDLVAPFGCEDLLALVVRPTAAFRDDAKTIIARATGKAWITRWPRLRFDPPSA